MKKYLIILICSVTVSAALQSCTSKPDYKVIRQKVLDQHDHLMIVGEKAMNTKIILDTLHLDQLKQRHPELDTIAEKRQILLLSKSLGNADDQMSDWMHAFKPDFKGNSEQDALIYFNDQKIKVARLDSLYKQRIEAANTYLKRFSIKPAAHNSQAMKM